MIGPNVNLKIGTIKIDLLKIDGCGFGNPYWDTMIRDDSDQSKINNLFKWRHLNRGPLYLITLIHRSLQH